MGMWPGEKKLLTVIFLISRRKLTFFPRELRVRIGGEDSCFGIHLSLYKSHRPCKSPRAKVVPPEIINHWFIDVLKPILDRADLHNHPERIFNADETSFYLCGIKLFASVVLSLLNLLLVEQERRTSQLRKKLTVYMSMHMKLFPWVCYILSLLMPFEKGMDPE